MHGGDWNSRLFIPSLDATGKPQTDTLRTTANETARSALVEAWPWLIEQALAGCREELERFYWRKVFVPMVTSAASNASPPVP